MTPFFMLIEKKYTFFVAYICVYQIIIVPLSEN